MKKYNIFLFSILTVIFFASLSCSKWDDYKQHIDNGETHYTGKMDSVKIYPGNLRVRVVGLLPADPSIVKCAISWKGNDLNTDSVVFSIDKPGRNTMFDHIFKVDEGTKNFKIQTFDSRGNSSVVVQVTGTVYGPNFESTLINRPVNSAKLFGDGNVVIQWSAIDTSTGAKGTIVRYVNTEDDTISKFTPVSIEVDTLYDYKPGTTFEYNTVYLPDSMAIDTFYTDYQVQSVKADVTNIYLSNTGPGFQRAANDGGGRFGVLAAPWIENATAKNKGGGTIGGYTWDNRWGHSGQLNWETWGSTPVTDGKIYQVTSKPLPAGTYTVKFQYYSEIQSNSSVYCVVAAGSHGIPSLPDLSDALGYSLLYNGANVGSTSPNREEIKTFNFTIESPQIVTIGFLGNLVGNGNPGCYFVVGYIKLIQN